MIKKLIQMWFKTSQYRDFKLALENSVLFNKSYYKTMRNNKPFRINDLSHYFVNGHLGKVDPIPHFNSQYYLSENPDVKKSKMNPLYHYILQGEEEGRKPNPFFDPKIYLALNQDLNGWNATLLEHYMVHGMDEGRLITPLINNNNIDKNTDYIRWINKNENLLFLDLQKGLANLTFTPKISIVVPVYNPDKQLLIKCIESVISQSYTNWELCLADDKSTEEHVREVLEFYRAKDKRIKSVFLEKNGHISAASNSALELATGEWIALLDHDDELHQHALYHVVSAINERPETEFIYSDEDKINKQGKRIDPHFKSDWNLDLLYSQNFVSHLGVYKDWGFSFRL